MQNNSNTRRVTRSQIKGTRRSKSPSRSQSPSPVYHYIKKHKISEKRFSEILSDKFSDIMYDYMWQYMNEDTISNVLENLRCKIGYQKIKNFDTYTTKYPKKYNNSIVFKGNPETCGHYVYINPNGIVYGTLECGFLYQKDCGVCHGFAIAAALKNCGYGDKIGTIYLNPSEHNHIERLSNYIAIMNTYKLIIQEGGWENAVYNHFYYDFVPKKRKITEEEEEEEIVKEKIKTRTNEVLDALNKMLIDLTNALKKEEKIEKANAKKTKK